MSQLTGLQQLNYIDLWKLYDNAISKVLLIQLGHKTKILKDI